MSQTLVGPAPLRRTLAVSVGVFRPRKLAP